MAGSPTRRFGAQLGIAGHFKGVVLHSQCNACRQAALGAEGLPTQAVCGAKAWEPAKRVSRSGALCDVCPKRVA